MRIRSILVVTASLLTGCATTDHLQRAEHHGEGTAPADANRVACKERPASGPDQALFKRALLSLRPNPDIPVSKRGRELLKRLKKQYPASPWTAQAAPVMELINITDDLVRENEDLKATIRSLNREIKELNGNLKQLKDLDLELEQER